MAHGLDGRVLVAERLHVPVLATCQGGGGGVSGVAATGGGGGGEWCGCHGPECLPGEFSIDSREILSQNPKTYLRNQVLNLEIFMFFYNTNQFI